MLKEEPYKLSAVWAGLAPAPRTRAAARVLSELVEVRRALAAVGSGQPFLSVLGIPPRTRELGGVCAMYLKEFS